jgi:hypothetical protein
MVAETIFALTEFARLHLDSSWSARIVYRGDEDHVDASHWPPRTVQI